jgi:hypothetical protein
VEGFQPKGLKSNANRSSPQPRVKDIPCCAGVPRRRSIFSSKDGRITLVDLSPIPKSLRVDWNRSHLSHATFASVDK